MTSTARRCYFCGGHDILTVWQTAVGVRLACVDRGACAARVRAEVAADLNRAATS